MDVKGDGAVPSGAGAHSSDAIAALKTKAVVPRTTDVRWSGMMSPVRFAADGPPIKARQDGRCQCARYPGEENSTDAIWIKAVCRSCSLAGGQIEEGASGKGWNGFWVRTTA